MNKMMDAIRKIRDVFFYCGLSKEEYKAIKREAYVSNFKVWKYLHCFMAFAFLLLGTVFYVRFGLTAVTYIQFGMFVYCVIAALVFFLTYQPDSLIAQFAIYLTMILLLISMLLINVFQPDAGGVTFIVLLVMLPMFMIDKPYFMALVLSLAVLLYLTVVKPYKTPDVYMRETVYAVFYGVFGIFINTFYNTIRIHEFTMQKRERELINAEKSANEETRKLNGALKKMSESALELLGDVVEGRDEESGEHIMRVKGYSYILATQVMNDLPEYQLDPYTVDLIAFTSVLHDVGKISIPDAILCKPGKLTAEEFEIMKTHCDRGCAILSKMQDKWAQDYYEMGMTICRYHHEKWDGKGYPKGLKGDEIPIAAQIVSIADIFDALTTKRVYKDAYSYDTAFKMIITGECGAFSEKLVQCFIRCYDQFKAHAENTDALDLTDRDYELVSKTKPEDSFVIGLHDSNKTFQEKIHLDEEISVLQSLSERYFYICYVNMVDNRVIRFMADEQFERILNSYGDELKSYERFDKLLNSIIVSEDYDRFRQETERNAAIETIRTEGRLTTEFRIRLEDGIHYSRMRITPDKHDPNAVIIGISNRDEAHERELKTLDMRNELEVMRMELVEREKQAERMMAIESINGEYDYICVLDRETMEVTEYRYADWMRDMIKNMSELVASPESRAQALRGIIYPDDFETFKVASIHANVEKGLAKNGVYEVNYRAFKYGQLMNYQTRYVVDRKDPRKIIIGLRSLGTIELS